MSIILTPFASAPVCHGNAWAVQDEIKLANQIATVALGQSRHVERILAGTSLGPPPNTNSTSIAAIKLLTAVGDPWHRDGWMFQVISWIAAHTGTPGGVIRPPHMILAHKGYDGLQLEVDANTGKVTAVVIFEDKATDYPRKTIREEVWPDLKQHEVGDRENVLTAEVVALLQMHSKVDPDLAIQNIIWKQARRYRISITVGDTHSTQAGHKRLFRDYDTVAAGPVNKRGGEIFHVKELRKWMAELANNAIVAIHARAASNV